MAQPKGGLTMLRTLTAAFGMVLMAGTANQNNTALRDHLLSSGFAQVTVLTGAPPALDQAASSSAAA